MNHSGQSGFTLVEVLAAMLIFTIIIAGLPSSFVAQLKYNTATEERTGAMQAAQYRLDELRLTDPTAMPDSGHESVNINIGSRNYETISSYCLNAAYCDSGARHITVEVRYRERSLYTVETVYSQLR